jgi:predicted dehydrogenase
MMTATSPDAVVVSTPTMTHYDVVRQAVQPGKHVLCEKPLCLTGDEADALGPVMIFDKGVTKKPREYADLGEFQLLTREGDVTVPRVPPEEPLRQQARALIEALEFPDKIRSDGRVGADVVRVLAAINESIAKIADEIVSLPMFPELTDAQIERVCAAVAEFHRV